MAGERLKILKLNGKYKIICKTSCFADDWDVKLRMIAWLGYA